MIDISFAAGDANYVEKLNAMIAQMNEMAADLGATWVGVATTSKNVAGNSDVTLTAEECAATFIALSGALTGNINVKVPAAVGLYFVNNATSGAYSLTFKTIAGSGVVVPQGAQVLLACNGTNVYVPVTNQPAIEKANIGVEGTAAQLGTAGYYSVYGSQVSVSSQADLSTGGVWTARNGTAAASGIDFGVVAGEVRIWGNTGLTSGNTFSPTVVATFKPSGIVVVGGDLKSDTDNTDNLGSAAAGWKEIFCDNGTINTSDERKKTKVRGFSDAELKAAKMLATEIGCFQFLASVEQKGLAARQHVGMTVQRAIAIMEQCGLDPYDYGFICHDQWDDEFIEHPAVEAVEGRPAVVTEQGFVLAPAIEAAPAREARIEQTQQAGDRYAFRVHELLLFIARGMEARIAALEAL